MGNQQAQDRQRAINETTDDLVHWRIYESIRQMSYC